MDLTVIKHDINEWQILKLKKYQLAVRWLGQAGFALRYGGRAFLIDPYFLGLSGKKI